MLALLQHPCSLEDSLEGEIYSVVCDTCMLHAGIWDVFHACYMYVTCRNLGCFPCMLHVHDNVLVTCDMTKHACYVYMM